jgi:hypothetical protein
LKLTDDPLGISMAKGVWVGVWCDYETRFHRILTIKIPKYGA